MTPTKLSLIAGILFLGAAGSWAWLPRSAPALKYRLAKVERCEVVATVNATGTVQPVSLVQVGTQVSGTVQKLFTDFNARVKAGDVVAQIDPALFETRVAQDKASLERAAADVERIQASMVQAENELARSRELFKRGLLSASDLDASVASHGSLAAQLKVAEATVSQSRATLKNSEVNLCYTTIASPIDGIVISRNVDVGQTVAASLQTPTLFLIADDLRKMQVQASVPEADIGRILVGQEASFAVDAYPRTRFGGKVEQIRLSPTSVQNVVTYTVIVSAENPEEKLLPGMTANLTFEVDRRAGVLAVPNAALRFAPASEPTAGSTKTAPEEDSKRGRHRHKQRVWIPDGDGLSEVQVVPGISDGNLTQIVEGNLKEGQEVVTGNIQEGAGTTVKNPFAPTMGRGGRR